MNHYIVDGMKKEGRIWRTIMVLGYSLAILIQITTHLIRDPRYSMGDAIEATAVLLFFGSLGLYGWLYAAKYHVEITEEKILLTTLFGKKELDLSEITTYSCKRYGRSVFYGFELRTREKKVLVYTRYQEALAAILRQNGIAETG